MLDIPTDQLPRTPGKIACMGRRARARLPLCRPDDAAMPEGTALLQVPGDDGELQAVGLRHADGSLELWEDS